MPNPNWGEVATTTLAHRRPKIADAISKSTVFWYEMRRRGRIRSVTGGRTITTPIMMGVESGEFMWYAGAETLSIDQQEVLTSAEYPWKQYACGVTLTGFDLLRNSGSHEVIDMLSARVSHAEKTIANRLSQAAHGDGTGSSGKEFGGLALGVSAADGATVGGIDSSADTWWDNYRLPTGEAPDKATIYGFMLQVMLNTTRGSQDRPNLITANNTWFAEFNEALQAQQRFGTADRKLAQAGFNNLMFQTAPVVFDGGIGGYHPAGMRFLNTETIEVLMQKDRNNVVLKGPTRPVDADTHTVILAGMGNIVFNNRMLNGWLGT
jgi:hypothetical protein